MARVLFVCLRNAGRSQISQAMFERAARGRRIPPGPSRRTTSIPKSSRSCEKWASTYRVGDRGGLIESALSART